MAVKTGKAATKGQKQIYEENLGTLHFYKNLAIGSNVIWFACCFFLFEEVSTLHWLVTFCSVGTMVGCLAFMKTMAKATFDDRKNILDGGIDLNMQSGVAEHIKDIIILTGGCQVLGCISDYFWFAWLLIPGRAFYLLWTSVLSPWFFSPSPGQEEDPAAASKKQRKMERKMKRGQS